MQRSAYMRVAQILAQSDKQKLNKLKTALQHGNVNYLSHNLVCWVAQWLLGWIYLDLFSTFFGIFYNRDGLGPSSVEYILGKKKIIHQNNNAIQLIYQNKRTPPTINEKERKIIPNIIYLCYAQSNFLSYLKILYFLPRGQKLQEEASRGWMRYVSTSARSISTYAIPWSIEVPEYNNNVHMNESHFSMHI